MPNVTFKWPADKSVKDVIVTGTFDNWSQTLPLVQRPDGSFELEVPLPKDTIKIEFKFVINGENWVTSEDYWTVVDQTGNTNNYIEFNQNGAILKNTGSLGKTEAGKTEVGKTIIPESGLSIATPAETTTTAAAEDFTPTVLPSQEGVQTTLGEPGIVVPENAQDISAFKEVRDIDAKQFNADIKKEEAASAADATEAEADETATATTDGSKTKYVKKVKKLVPADEVNAAKEETKEAKEEAKESPKKTTPTTKAVPAKKATPAAKDTAKKEKKGLFGKLKKAFS